MLPTLYPPNQAVPHVTLNVDAPKLAALLSANEEVFPVTFLPTTVMLTIDTGASISITPARQDFIGPIRPIQPTTLQGIASGLKVLGIGTAQYRFQRADGSVLPVTLKNVLYVPGCSVHLLCPRHLAAETGVLGDGFTSLSDHGVLRCHGYDFHVEYHTSTGLPIIHFIGGSSAAALSPDMCGFAAGTSMSMHHSSNGSPAPHHINLSNAQQLKLLLHERCNHTNMATINAWIRQGLLPAAPSIASSPDPICQACQFEKARRRSHKQFSGSITSSSLSPGTGVSADQLEAGCPGRIPTCKGLPTTKRYRYCNIWVDHFSRFIFPTFHETKHASELIRSKQEFQQFAAKYNVKISKIRADNGVYSSGPFQVACDQDGQDLSFCGVGGHWQNGVAERHIGTITQTARTLLLHAITHWPGTLSEKFWPFAIRHACNFHNASMDPTTGKSPHHLFTGDRAPWHLQDFRVFGCPTFVLDKRLQDGDSLPKWRSRCWTGVYVGHSLQHSGTVPLIYNPVTTCVSPQFHVTFDDKFTTVRGSVAILLDSKYEELYNSTEWLHKPFFGDHDDLHYFDSFWSAPPILCPPRTVSHRHPRNPVRKPRPLSPPVDCRPVSSPTGGEHAMSEHAPLSEHAKSKHAQPSKQAMSEHALLSEHAASEHALSTESSMSEHASPCEPIMSAPAALHTGEIPVRAPSSPLPYVNLCAAACSADLQHYQTVHGLHVNVYTTHLSQPSVASVQSVSLSLVHSDSDPISDHILAYAMPAVLPTASDAVSAMLGDNKADTLTQSQMFKAPDRAKFISCQADEIKSLYDLDIMDVHHISELPPRVKLLSSIWSYRRKRLPNGVLAKYKSRLCVNGKEQAFGRDYWETYAPVTAWSTIRLLLLLSTILPFKTRQVDYTSAFPQADLDVPVYMRVPQGWYVDSSGRLAQHVDPKYQDRDHYLSLKKNLYGCKQAARNWFKLLSEGLQSLGFKQSATDNCLFLRSDCIIMVYVDDCLFFAQKEAVINDVIQSLSRIFKLKDEGDVSAFLGVQLRKDPTNRTISLTQPGLIDQILRDVGINDFSKTKETPVDSILHPNLSGPPRVEQWNYRSVIGKLNYLANNTRPDISMAVHQCACFCVSPRALQGTGCKANCSISPRNSRQGYASPS
jgi:hypothetical protein